MCSAPSRSETSVVLNHRSAGRPQLGERALSPGLCHNARRPPPTDSQQIAPLSPGSSSSSTRAFHASAWLCVALTSSLEAARPSRSSREPRLYQHASCRECSLRQCSPRSCSPTAHRDSPPSAPRPCRGRSGACSCTPSEGWPT
eukprot:238636-Prymnesium_polylepis.2